MVDYLHQRDVDATAAPQVFGGNSKPIIFVDSERPIRPDVSVLQPDWSPSRESVDGTAVLETDAPSAIVNLSTEEVREPLIHISEPAAGNRMVMAIDILSPDNKAQGAGRESYLRNRNEFWQSGTNLIEIDLLREGLPSDNISEEQLKSLPAWDYLVSVSRQSPRRNEVYAITLAADDRNIALDFQAAFDRCWNEGPYPELLR